MKLQIGRHPLIQRSQFSNIVTTLNLAETVAPRSMPELLNFPSNFHNFSFSCPFLSLSLCSIGASRLSIHQRYVNRCGAFLQLSDRPHSTISIKHTSTTHETKQNTREQKSNKEAILSNSDHLAKSLKTPFRQQSTPPE